MKRCEGCGTTERHIRADGVCFRCHVRGIGFTFQGGGMYGRENFHNSTVSEFIRENVGDPRRENVERAR